MVTARLLEGQIHEGKMGVVEVDGFAARRVHERRGRAHGERDDRRAASATARVARELRVGRLQVPRAREVVVHRLVHAFAVALAALLLTDLVMAGVERLAERGGEHGEGLRGGQAPEGGRGGGVAFLGGEDEALDGAHQWILVPVFFISGAPNASASRRACSSRKARTPGAQLRSATSSCSAARLTAITAAAGLS